MRLRAPPSSRGPGDPVSQAAVELATGLGPAEAWEAVSALGSAAPAPAGLVLWTLPVE